MVKVNGKLQQTNPGKTTNDPDPSGLKVKLTVPAKEKWPAEVLAEGKGDTGCVVEEGSYKYYLQPDNQLQRWRL